MKEDRRNAYHVALRNMLRSDDLLFLEPILFDAPFIEGGEYAV